MSIREIMIDLEEFEGFSGEPYRCPAGYLTIGFGRNLDTNPLTMEEGRVLLMNDITKHTAAAARAYPTIHELDDVRRDILIEMQFQIKGGIAGFRKMLAAVQSGDYSEAARQMRDSKWWREDSRRRAEILCRRMEIGKRETT